MAKPEVSKPEKKKRKKKEKAEEAAEPKAAKAPAAAKVKVPATPEEEARRQKQRECRERALAAREGGKAYVSSYKVRAKKRPQQAQRKYDRRQEGLPSKAVRNTERRDAQKAAKAEKAKAPTVIIVPIFWKGESQQMAIVLSVCADVQKALEEGGVRCDSVVKVAPLAVPQLGSCASSERAWWPRAARHSQGEAQPLSAQPPQLFELAASKVADFTAFDRPGASSTLATSTRRDRSLHIGSTRASSCVLRWGRERRHASGARSQRRFRRARQHGGYIRSQPPSHTVTASTHTVTGSITHGYRRACRHGG